MPDNAGTEITQEGRILRITTPFENDYLLLQDVFLTEEISKLSTAVCTVLHDEGKGGEEATMLDVAGILGQFVTIEFVTHDGTYRTYTGLVNVCTQMERDGRFTYYRLEVVPAVWRLTLNQDSRIFQHLTVPDILKKVLGSYPHELQLGTVDWKPRNYLVQYRESDFDFISRLMEEEGIFYYFTHDENGHKMIICVDTGSHLPCPSKSEFPFYMKIEGEEFVPHITKMKIDYRLMTGKVALRDYSHQKPGPDRFEAAQPSRFDIGQNQKIEYYLFPSGSTRKHDIVGPSMDERSSELQYMTDDLNRTVENMQQAFDAKHRLISGESVCCSMTAGHKFKLFNHPNSELNGQYVITKVTHSAVQSPSYYTGMPEGDYMNSFECITWGQGAAPFRPEKRTKKPMILSSQTAVVVGPAGQEIYTDKYGRVKVRFHWDRESQSDEGSSCWARVAQHWAGNRWGSMFIPRIGMEVLVHFLEGDPDQPIITGCVYNNDLMPAYELPEHKTKSGIKSDSTVGGGGFNELRFEDEKGKEHIFVHAQKDQHIRVKSTRRELIGGDRHLTVGRDKREKIGRDSHIIIEGAKYEDITADSELHIAGNLLSEVDGEVASKVGGDFGLTVGGTAAAKSMNFYIKADMNLVIEAGAGLTLKGPGGFITINPAGVAIQGTTVLINSGGSALPGQSPTPPRLDEVDEAELPLNANPGDKAPTYKQQQAKVPEWKIPKYKKPTFKRKKSEDKELHWIEIQLNDDEGNPVPFEEYQVEMPDGSLATGKLDSKGFARKDGIDPGGTCKVTFPKLDKDTWKKA